MEPVTLDSLAGGGVLEKFQEALNRVILNIQDPNTKPDQVREITIKVKIKPTKSRDIGTVAFQVAEKLAPHEAIETQVLMGIENGHPIAREFYGSDPRQMDIEDEIAKRRQERESPAVVPVGE